jgi:hypothetical protein
MFRPRTCHGRHAFVRHITERKVKKTVPAKLGQSQIQIRTKASKLGHYRAAGVGGPSSSANLGIAIHRIAEAGGARSHWCPVFDRRSDDCGLRLCTLALSGPTTSYWIGFLLPIAIELAHRAASVRNHQRIAAAAVYLGFRSASLAQRIGKVAMKRAVNRPPQGTPRHGGNGRDEVLAKLKCSMRAVQSYPFRKPALQVLPDRSPANAAFVAWDGLPRRPLTQRLSAARCSVGRPRKWAERPAPSSVFKPDWALLALATDAPLSFGRNATLSAGLFKADQGTCGTRDR